MVSADHGGGSGTTNAQGEYSITVDYGWSGTITPTKEGYIFDPASKTYTNVTENQMDDVDELLRKAAERKAAEERARGPEPEEPLISKIAGKALISNVFVDTDLRQALQDIASQVGVIIILYETVVGLVTCEIKEVPLEKALEIALFSHRLNSEEQASPCVPSAKS